MARMQKIIRTQDFLPVRDIQDGIIITTDGRFVKLMEFSPINFDLRSIDEQAAIIDQFAAVLRIMPKTIQFKVVTRRANIEKFTSKIKADIRAETNRNCIQLQKEQILKIESLGSSSGVSRQFYVSFEYESTGDGKKNPSFELIDSELHRQAGIIRNALKSCGNEQVSIDHSDEWTMKALFNILCRYESEQRDFESRTAAVLAGYAQAKGFDFSSTLNLPVTDFIAPMFIDPSRNPNYLVVDNLYYRFCYIQANSYPIRAAGGWTQMLMNLGEGIDMDLWLHKEDVAATQRRLQYRIRANNIKMKSTEDTSSDFESLSEAIESGYYLKEGLANGDDFCYFGTMITITALSDKDLEAKYQAIRNYCVRHDLTLKPCRFQQLDAFKMAMPICTLKPSESSLVSGGDSLFKKMRRNILLSEFASAYPFSSFEMSDDDGILLGTNQQNGSLVFLDQFDTSKYTNANISILGSSGSGKTYTLQCMALRLREKQQQVFIIAPLKGWEFERACRAVGGQYIKIAPGSGQNINIMEIRKADTEDSAVIDGGSGAAESILAKKIQQLHAFFAIMIKDMSLEENQVLDEALMQTYENFGITTKNRSLFDLSDRTKYKPMPVLGDLQEVLKVTPGGERLSRILTQYITGSAASFNQHTNVNLDNKYIVLDVSTMTTDMLPLGMYLALDYVWDKVKANRIDQKTVFIDECWRLIGPGSTPLAAEFVLEVFKTIRGVRGSAVCATQDLNDFFALEDGRFGTGIINNSRIKMLLKPEPKEAETLSGALELTETELAEVKRVDKGTCLLIANTNHVFIRIEASKTEHDLITTDGKDLERIRNEKISKTRVNDD